MRPSTIMAITVGVVTGLASIALGILVFVDRGHGKPWYYWFAPILTLGVGFVMIQLVVMYFVKVGRLEIKGRPRSD